VSFTTRRAGGLAGLSFIATTGLLGAYLGYPGLRKAQAATTCTVTSADDDDTAPYTSGELRYCLDQVDTYGGGAITFDPSVTDTIALSSSLPQVTLTSSLTIIGNGRDNTRIDGRNSHSVFSFTGNHTVSISGLTIVDGRTNIGGSAVRSVDGNVVLQEVRITDNYGSDNGGAVYAQSGDVTVSDSTFDANSAYYDGGGAIRAKSGDVTIERSVFIDNVAILNPGGAVKAENGSLIVSNSTFSGNDASHGGAIFAQNPASNVEINFSTITGSNTLSTNSSAVDSAGDVTVTNSIVHGNTIGDVQAGGTLSTSYSLFTSSSSVSPTVSGATLIFGEDPLLGALANNGGSTLTMMPGAGSPVLGAANPAGAPATDQRGYTRTTNGRADMGAVERLGVPPAADPSQVPPSWHQATSREAQESSCPPGMAPSWAQWPNEGTGGWTCEYTTWWDVNEGVGGGWVTTPGFRAGRIPGL